MDASIGAPHLRRRSGLREWDANASDWPQRTHGSSFSRQESAEDEHEDYGANRHAAAALLGFTSRSKAVKEEVDAELEALPPVKKKRAFKKRKATHTVRKEEKMVLETELKALQAQLEALKFQALVDHGEEKHSPRKGRAHTAVLREAVQDQHLVLARAQAMLAGHAQQNVYRIRPTEMKIRLGTDRTERRQTLNSLRGPKLREARQFMIERRRSLSPTASYFQEERYDTPDGDYCVSRFDVTPFRGVAGGVRAVFAALQQAAFNAEIILSETSGNITIREDDDLGDPNLSQMRLVTQTTRGVQLETNLVLFSDSAHCQNHVWGLADDGRYAIMASDFVDEDELYPYRPHERIRRDSTSVIMVTSYMDTVSNESSPSVKSEKAEELVVVVTRWAFAKTRHPAVNISQSSLHELYTGQVRWADIMLNCVRQTLGLPAEEI
ncbi:hypothetical protein BBJ28_00003202 [Nothophytophthora sp. Chile5]|nr:hypothetical protein BBJ28_00003202 [Nothophytophthora sp. Chile5]